MPPQSPYLVDPYPALAHLRDEAPVSLLHTAEGLPVWLVTGYEQARAALADPRIGQCARRAAQLAERHTGRPAAVDIVHMLNSDPPDHTRLRQLVHAAFSPGRTAALRPAIERLVDELLDRLSGEVDLVAEFAFPLPITVVGGLLGLPASDAPRYRRWATGILSLGEPGASGAAAAEMTAYLRSLLAGKREGGTDDLLGELVRAADAHRLSDDEVVGMAFLLLIGGHETTVNLLSTATLALMRSPDQRARLRADPAGAVHELLRYEPPVGTATLRFTTEPVELGGAELPAGSFLLVSLAAANRDPERFDEPDRLDLARGDRGHLAFGHGIHRCLGASLGLLEAEIALSRLFDRFPDVCLTVDESALRWRNSTMLRGLEALPVNLGQPIHQGRP